jgi:short-subunit dehydrogenase
MRLQGSVVLLTGATGGMGKAMVHELVEAGAYVIMVGRDAAALQSLSQQHPGRLEALPADLTVAADRERVVAHMQGCQGFNLLINAAGINHFALFDQQSEQQIMDLISVNVTASLLITRALLPLLRRVPQACVVNVGSSFGSIGYPGFAAYCATKFALRGFSEALRRELSDTHVGVLYLAPRATRTTMNSAAVEEMNAALGVSMDNPVKVARALINALQRDLQEVHLGFPEKILVRLNGLLPGVIHRALRKQLPVIRRFAQTEPSTKNLAVEKSL